MQNLRRISLVSCIAVFAMSVTVHAGTVRDLTWYEMDSGVTDSIDILTGTSIDNFYFASGGTAIRKYNAVTSTWADLSSWTDHFTGNSNWDSAVTRVTVAASGSNIYVMPRNKVEGQIGYFNGTSWSDVLSEAERVTKTYNCPMAIEGTTAIGYGDGGYLVKVVDGVMATGFPKTDMDDGAGPGLGNGLFDSIPSIDSNGSGVYWARNAGTPGRVSKSTDGGVTWTEVANLPLGGSSNHYSIHAIDADKAIVSQANGGRVYRTDDGGTTWNQVGDTFTSSTTRGIYVNDWDDIFAYGSFAGLYHWDGDDWAYIALPDHQSTESLRAMVYVDGEYWVSGNGGTMYSTLPEPATLSLLAAGGLLALLRRRRP